MLGGVVKRFQLGFITWFQSVSAMFYRVLRRLLLGFYIGFNKELDGFACG